MAEGDPIACSLDAGELRNRLKEIAKMGAESLSERNTDGNRHLLRFRPDEETRLRLEAIVATEAQCCSFLDLSLEHRGDALVLSIGAPEGGQMVADGLAEAFAGPGATNFRPDQERGS